jgi:5,10-methylenetetrahydromethanopterin reductase
VPQLASAAVRIGLRLPPCRPVDEMAAAAARAEDLGFDGVWFPDSQLLWRDAYATAAAAQPVVSGATAGPSASIRATGWS